MYIVRLFRVLCERFLHVNSDAMESKFPTPSLRQSCCAKGNDLVFSS